MERNERVRAKQPTKYSKSIRIITVLLVVLIVGCAGAVGWLYLEYKGIQKDPLKHFGGPGSTVKPTDGGDVLTSDGIVNVLLLGIDSDAERKSQSMGERSDVIIVCSIDTLDGTLSMLTIPRDTLVSMNKLDSKGKVTGTLESKITEAYAYGGGTKGYGAENAINSVENYLSCNGQIPVKIHYYATIDMDGFPKLADAVGGVEVTLTQPYIDYKAGDTITVTSANADDFARNRKYGGHGDEGRSERQQLFLVSFVRKVQQNMQSKGTVSVATSLYNEVVKYVNTNLNLNKIVAMAEIAKDINLDTGMNRYRLESKELRQNGISYQVVDEDELYNAVLTYLYKPKSS